MTGGHLDSTNNVKAESINVKGEENISGFVSMFSVSIEHEADLKNNLNMNEKDQEKYE